jgi:hypothetical protein
MSEVRDYSWGTYAEQKSENECYENLANAVVEQAVADMANAVMRKELASRDISEADSTFVRCANFFSGELLKSYTSVDGEILTNAAIQQGHYLVWKHDRGCSRCKFAKSRKCAHGQGGAGNWYAWSKGERTCMYTDKQIRKNKPNVDELPDVF